MTDLMLHGVLNMPPDLWTDSTTQVSQRFDRYQQASELIKSQAKKIEELAKALIENYHYGTLERRDIEAIVEKDKRIAELEDVLMAASVYYAIPMQLQERIDAVLNKGKKLMRDLINKRTSTREVLELKWRIAELKAENNKLKMPIDLGERIIFTKEQFETHNIKQRVAAIRDAAETFRIINGASTTDLLGYADKLEQGAMSRSYFISMMEYKDERIAELESHNLGLTKTLVEIEKDREIRDLEQQAKGLENYANEELSGLAAHNIHWMLIRAKDLREQAKQLKEGDL